MNTTGNPTTITAQPGTPFLQIVREFAAPPELVFRAHADPDLVVQWLGPRDLTAHIEEWDVRSGGSYRYRHTGTAEHRVDARFRGVFHTVQPSALIIQTWEWDGAPNQVCLETHRFEDLGGGRTRLTSNSVFPSVGAQEMALASGMTHGIYDSMDRLAELLPTLT